MFSGLPQGGQNSPPFAMTGEWGGEKMAGEKTIKVIAMGR